MKFIFLWIFLLVLNTSCTRPDKEVDPDEKARGIKDVFVPGLADNLYKAEQFQVIDIPSQTLDLSAISGKTLKIKTSKTGKKAKVSMSTTGVFIDPHSNISFVNQYYFLDYDILSAETDTQKLLKSFLGKVELFKGFPDTVYTIVPHLENNYLILYRLSDPKKVPYDELSISYKVGDKIATPLVGYPVYYCVAEKILNVNHEETGQSRPRCEGVGQETAQYIRLRKQDKRVFSYQPKVDIFPNDFFDGQWFFVKSVVKSSEDTLTGFHQAFRSANLVEFGKTPDNLRISDASGYEIDEKDQVISFAIPVQWKEYEIDRDSDIIHKFAERDSHKTPDIERPYFKIKFKELARIESNNDSIPAEIEVIFITDDYFSFTVRRISAGKNKWVKYAFKKMVKNENYVEKQWFEDDSSKFFPVFYDVRKYYDKMEEHTQADKEKFFRVTRFDPRPTTGSTKVIKWYFSKQTPREKWVRDFGRKAVQLWDKAFQEAGKDSDYQIRIVLDESEDKELGDIRYNIVNLMVSESQASIFLGFGPNISNPITGETVSATTNVWVSNIIDHYIGILRKYIRFHIFSPAWQLVPDTSGVTQFLHEKIQKRCPKVTVFIETEKAKNKPFHPTETVLNDKEIIRECAYTISQENILSTVLHEMGHGLAYRHVFSASADKENFYANYEEITSIFGKEILFDDTKSYPNPAQFSSVMDYLNFYFPVLTVPGKYDIAVTRFVYFDKVELEDGGFLTVPAGADADLKSPQKNILRTEAEQTVRFKRYKVCGGKKQDEENSDFHFEKICFKWDYGVTPQEIINNEIEYKLNELMRKKMRYDSDYIISDLSSRLFYGSSFAVNSLKHWFNLRDTLLSRHRRQFSDFSFLNDNDIQSYKQLIEEEANSNPEFKLYYDFRQVIFDYYKKILFMPVKQCVYKKSDGTYNVIALEVIRKRIEVFYPKNSREIFMNCQSPAVKKWAEEEARGEFVVEVGYFGNNIKYFVKPTKEDQYNELSPFDTLIPLPNFWLDVIMSGIPLLKEPDFAKEILHELKLSILEGVDLNPYLNRSLSEKLPRFLSYEIESMTGNKILNSKGEVLRKPLGILQYKLGLLVATINVIANNSDQRITNEVMRNFGNISLDVSRLVQIGEGMGFPYPSLETLYQKYSSSSGVQDSDKSFINFLIEHPDLCVQPVNKQTIILPYAITEDHFTVQMCRKFNKYRTCIANHDTVPCENIEDKKAYVQLIGLLLQEKGVK